MLGYINQETILVGVKSHTSSPVKIIRHLATLQSIMGKVHSMRVVLSVAQ